VSGGEDAQGEASVKISYDGRRWNGRGLSTDIIESTIKAYVAAINAMEWELEAFTTGDRAMLLDALLMAFPALGLAKIVWAVDIILAMNLPGFSPVPGPQSAVIK